MEQSNLSQTNSSVNYLASVYIYLCVLFEAYVKGCFFVSIRYDKPWKMKEDLVEVHMINTQEKKRKHWDAKRKRQGKDQPKERVLC